MVRERLVLKEIGSCSSVLKESYNSVSNELCRSILNGSYSSVLINLTAQNHIGLFDESPIARPIKGRIA